MQYHTYIYRSLYTIPLNGVEHIVSRIGIRMIRRETQVQLTEDVTGNAVSIVGQGWVNGRPTCKDQKVCKDTRTTILSQKATQ